MSKVTNEKSVIVKDFHNEIRKAVIKANQASWSLTFKDCEQKLGFKGISNWTKGKRNFDLDKMLRIAEYFELRININVQIRPKNDSDIRFDKSNVNEFKVVSDERN